MYLLSFKYLLVLFVGILLLSFIGKFILSIAGISKFDSPYANFAASQITGISFSIIATAIYFTHGQTIMLGLIPIFIFTWLEMRKNKMVSFSTDLTTRFKGHFSKLSVQLAIEIAVVASIAFICQAYTFVALKRGIPVESNADIHIVSFASNAMMSSGIERNYIFDIPSSITSAPSPYHYFEYWFVILFSKIFGNLPIYNIKFHLIPIFISVLYALFCTLAECFNIRINYFHKLLGVGLVLFAAPVRLVLYNTIISRDVASDPMLYKSTYLIWIIIISLIALLNRKNNLAIIAFLSYVVVTYTALPIIFPSLFSLFVLGFITKKYIKKETNFLYLAFKDFSVKDLVTNSIYTAIIGIILILFYKIGSMNVVKDPSFPYSYADSYSLKNVILNFNSSYGSYFFRALYPISGLLIILFAALYISKRVNNKKPEAPEILFYLFFGIQFLFSGIFFTLFQYDYNNFVLYRITNLPFITVFFALVGLKWYKEFEGSKIVRYLILVPILLIMAKGGLRSFQFYKERKKLFAGTNEPVYRDKIEEMLKKTGSTGVFMKSEELLINNTPRLFNEYGDNHNQTSFLQRVNNATYHLGMYLDYYKPDVIVHPITKNPYTEPGILRNNVIDDLNETYFYTSYCKNILKNGSLSENQKRIAFIKYTNAGFLIASKYASIDPSIYSLFVDSAINARDGERFYLLNTYKK